MSAAAADARGAPLLAVRDLAVRFPVRADLRTSVREGGARFLQAVDGVSFELARGETLALVGESGCGKSTLARAIAGLVRAHRGSVTLGGVELTALSRRGWRAQRQRVQMVFQDPDASLNPRMTAAALIGEPLWLHRGLRGAALDARVCELMERVGLDPALRRRFPHAFSGGQRQRIGIARALAVEPSLLLCDEVTSALDVSVQAQILELLRRLQRELGLAMLFITHDLGVVKHIAQRVAVMYLGQIVESAPTAALFDEPAHPYSRTLLAAVPRIGAAIDAAGGGAVFEAPGAVLEVPSPLAPPPGCRFHPRCPVAMDRCRHEPPPLFAVHGRVSRCFLAGDPGDPGARAAGRPAAAGGAPAPARPDDPADVAAPTDAAGPGATDA